MTSYQFRSDEILVCRKRLLNWYTQFKRPLPWRDPSNKTPYSIWISEIMSQQTRIETVIPYWKRWMDMYPSVQALSQAKPEDINFLWAGLGYYRRGRLLLEGAKKIVSDYNGVIPSNIVDLLKIPGIGPYTAGAISSIAFDQTVPLVDGNVIRVLSRLRAIEYETNSKEMNKLSWELATVLVDPLQPGNFNQALMELGATVCTPSSPTCQTCPLQEICLANRITNLDTNSTNSKKKKENLTKKSSIINHDDDDIENLCALKFQKNITSVTYFPVKSCKKKPREIVFSVCVLRLMNGSDDSNSESVKYLFIQRPENGLLAKQWEFPNIVLFEENKRNNIETGNNDIANNSLNSSSRNRFQKKGKITMQDSTSSDGHSIDAPITLESDTDEESNIYPNNNNNSVLNSNILGDESTEPVLTVAVEKMIFSEEQRWCAFPDYFNKIGVNVQWTSTNIKESNSCSNLEDSNSQLSLSQYTEVLEDNYQNLRTIDKPIIHIFSHQKHIMHIFIKDIQYSHSYIMRNNNNQEKSKKTSITATEHTQMMISSSSTQHKFLTVQEIEKLGITSGCKKILEVVSNHCNNNSNNNNSVTDVNVKKMKSSKYTVSQITSSQKLPRKRKSISDIKTSKQIDIVTAFTKQTEKYRNIEILE